MKDESVIPKGYYCEDCPYWSIYPDKSYQENGYCEFLEKGDWDLNSEREYTNIKTGEVIEDAKFSLLWDGCKECYINMGDKDD